MYFCRASLHQTQLTWIGALGAPLNPNQGTPLETACKQSHHPAGEIHSTHGR
jgi:hypothetical protein